MSADVQSRINAYWTGRAPSYDAWQRRPGGAEEERALWRETWSAALPAAPLDVLDVGTGSGTVACHLAALGHRVTGIDLAPGMLDAARANAAREDRPPRILLGDAVSPDFADASFDVVTGRYVMWTLREPVEALAAWQRLLRPGGLVAVVDSTWFPEGVGPELSSMRGYYDDEVLAALPLATARSIDATTALLVDSGLSDVEARPLPEHLELHRRLGVAPGHDLQLEYLLTGRRAG